VALVEPSARRPTEVANAVAKVARARVDLVLENEDAEWTRS
jgi:hypothetical protein